MRRERGEELLDFRVAKHGWNRPSDAVQLRCTKSEATKASTPGTQAGVS